MRALCWWRISGLSAELLSPFRSFLKFSIAAQTGQGARGAGWKDGAAHEKKAAEWADCVGLLCGGLFFVFFLWVGFVFPTLFIKGRYSRSTVGAPGFLGKPTALCSSCCSWCSRLVGTCRPPPLSPREICLLLFLVGNRCAQPLLQMQPCAAPC